MKAYELADELKHIAGADEVEETTIHIATILLRQQADRIAELEKDLHMIQRHYDQLDNDISEECVAKTKKQEQALQHLTDFDRIAELEEQNQRLSHHLKLITGFKSD